MSYFDDYITSIFKYFEDIEDVLNSKDYPWLYESVADKDTYDNIMRYIRRKKSTATTYSKNSIPIEYIRRKKMVGEYSNTDNISYKDTIYRDIFSKNVNKMKIKFTKYTY